MGSVQWGWDVHRGVEKGGALPVTSSSRTSSLSLSTSRPSRRRSFVPEISLRAVAMTGRLVVLRRRRVSPKPMPREEGVVKIHERAMVQWI